MPVVEEKVSRLERALASFIEQEERFRREDKEERKEFRENFETSRREFREQLEEDRRKFREHVERSERSRLEEKEEMREFREQLLKMQQQADKDREQADKDRETANKERKDFNKRMAELSDRMGTLVEDMVAPNGERIAAQIFGDDPVLEMIQRYCRRKGGDSMELDLLVVGKEHVMIVESKRRLRSEDIKAFLRRLERFKEFFPEFANHQLVPVVASVTIEPSIITNLNRRKIYGLAFGDETMELVNLNQF